MLATVMGLWHAVLFILETQKRTALWAEFLHSIVPDNQYWFFQAKFCGMYMVHSKVFCQYCCDVIWFIRIAIVPWTWSSFAECCYGGLLNVVNMVVASQTACLFTNFPWTRHSRLHGGSLTCTRVQLKKTSPILTETSPRLVGWPVWYLGLSLVALAVVAPVQDVPNSAVHFKQLLLKIKFVDLIIYLSWPSLTTLYAYPVTPIVILFLKGDPKNCYLWVTVFYFWKVTPTIVTCEVWIQVVK